jgi:hypothetical protein
VNASPAPSGIGRHKPAKQNQSSPVLVNFHFDFGGFVPVNSKKCDAGIRPRRFGNPRPSERKLITGARFGLAGDDRDRQHLRGLKRVRTISPYTEAVDGAEHRFFAEGGIEAIPSGHIGIADRFRLAEPKAGAS